MIELSNDKIITGTTYSQSNYQEYEENINIFEEVIDDLILDGYSKSDEEKDYIKSLPRDKKRMARLSLMSDNNILWNKIYEIHCGDDTKYNKIKKIIILLRDYVKIADVEKKEHGEILTPFEELAKPMVNMMDKYDNNFWKNPENKVLDSSAGYGTFLILCLYKFMEGLIEFEPDENLRLKHIIENQLYYGELQSKSVFSWLVAIDPNDEYKTNIYWGSYLEEGFDYHMENIWNVEGFDLIIQNPPYQMLKLGFKKSQPLWHLFVEKSLRLVKDDKYMIMVHPDGWRAQKGLFKEIQTKLRSKQMLYLEVHDKNEGFKMFGATTTYDFYILKNTNNIDGFNTTIKCVNGDFEMVDILNMEFIPNAMFNEYKKLVAKDDDEIVKFIHSYSAYEHRKNHMSVIETNEYKYPCVYYTYKDGSIRLMYSNTNERGHFGVLKVIWSFGGVSTPIVDIDVKYGQVEFAYSIVDDIENLENIKKAMLSNRFIEIMSFSDGTAGIGGQRYNSKIISTFKKNFWKEFI